MEVEIRVENEEVSIENLIKTLLPVIVRSSRMSGKGVLFWPSTVVEILKALASGCSGVDSGESLFESIWQLRELLSLERDNEGIAPCAREGYTLCFDELMSREESSRWFGNTLPSLAHLLMELPSLLEQHYHEHKYDRGFLRFLGPQQPGIVFLSQKLIAALLACAFFCLFPILPRTQLCLPPFINFDYLFQSLYDSYSEQQESKIRCILHYFERVTSSMPIGSVSFERKVLPFEQLPYRVSYPQADYWSNSTLPLSRFEVQNSGCIEDHCCEAVEVDFANKYIGGGTLNRGCVQEEIRFMINPELIAGMLFMACMEDNEAIEIVGTERFSDYTGYASSFRFSGGHMDRREFDALKRRKTRIVAIDASCCPRMRQYSLEGLLRETNKAFCGFFDQSKSEQYQRLLADIRAPRAEAQPIDFKDAKTLKETPSNSAVMGKENGESLNRVAVNSSENACWFAYSEDQIGVTTGNWGCGAFGGDPELKAIIQWLAASQALRPIISYYTFGVKELHNLEQVSQWILSHEWTVGDLWNMLVEYSSQMRNEETAVGFFTWLLPSLKLPRNRGTTPSKNCLNDMWR